MIEMAVTAFVLGVAVAMPPGSVSIEAGRRAITFGFKPAFLFNLGSTTADALYALVVYLGLAPLLERSEAFKLGLWIVGGAWLFWLGWLAFRTRISAEDFAEAAKREPAWRSYAAGVGVTLLNPLTIFAWISLAGNFFATWKSDWLPLDDFGWLAVVLMLCGVMTWMAGLMALLSSLRHLVNPRMVNMVSMLAGLFLMGYALRSWWLALGLL